jgi:glycosyltransferase involved in cell wall biosynthesis
MDRLIAAPDPYDQVLIVQDELAQPRRNRQAGRDPQGAPTPDRRAATARTARSAGGCTNDAASRQPFTRASRRVEQSVIRAERMRRVECPASFAVDRPVTENALSIVHVLSHRKVRRGGAVQALLLAQAQHEAGHRVLVVVNAKSKHAKVHASFGPWRERGLAIEALYLPRLDARLRLRRRIADARADVVHVHRNEALVAAYFATLGMRRLALVEQRGTTRALQTALVRWIHARKRPHRIIAVSAAVKDALIAEGVKPERVAVVFGSFDPGRFDPARIDGAAVRAEFGGSPTTSLVIQVGALTAKKGTDDFLRAIAALVRAGRDVRGVLVGQGKDDERYARVAAELGIESRVLFAGFRTDVPEVLAAADVVANGSTGREGLTGVLREAAAMGRPIVATAVDGNPELIRDGATGLLVPARDPQRMAQAIASLLDDPGRARTLGAAARRFVLDEMHPDVRLARVLAVYADAIAVAAGRAQPATA